MHVVKFLDSLLQTPDIEIVETSLPETAERIIADRECQTGLPGKIPLPAAHAVRNALLQNLNDRGRRTFGRLADQQMDVFRHHDIPHQGESVAVACFSQDLDKRIASANGGQQWQPPVASESDEMKMAASKLANEFVSHGEKQKSTPRPSKNRRVGHPEELNHCPGRGCIEWYDPAAITGQEEKWQKRVPPASAQINHRGPRQV